MSTKSIRATVQRPETASKPGTPIEHAATMTVPATPTPPNVDMIEAGVSMAFRQAADNFQKHPSTVSWRVLETSMYALQYWRGTVATGNRETVAAALWAMPIGAWNDYLHAEALDVSLPGCLR